MSSTKLHGPEGNTIRRVKEKTEERNRNREREREKGRQRREKQKAETILSKRIQRERFLPLSRQGVSTVRAAESSVIIGERRCTAERVPLFRLTGITALEQHGTLLPLSFSLSIPRQRARGEHVRLA